MSARVGDPWGAGELGVPQSSPPFLLSAMGLPTGLSHFSFH